MSSLKPSHASGNGNKACWTLSLAVARSRQGSAIDNVFCEAYKSNESAQHMIKKNQNIAQEQKN